MCICLQLLSNQSFYRQITSYGMSLGDHRGSLMMKGGHGQTNQLHVHSTMHLVHPNTINLVLSKLGRAWG